MVHRTHQEIHNEPWGMVDGGERGAFGSKGGRSEFILFKINIGGKTITPF